MFQKELKNLDYQKMIRPAYTTYEEGKREPNFSILNR